MEKTVTRRMILSVAETVGMTSKKVLEVLFLLRHGQAVENNELVNNKTNHFKDEIDSTTKLDNRLNEVLTINNNKIKTKMD